MSGVRGAMYSMNNSVLGVQYPLTPNFCSSLVKLPHNSLPGKLCCVLGIPIRINLTGWNQFVSLWSKGETGIVSWSTLAARINTINIAIYIFFIIDDP